MVYASGQCVSPVLQTLESIGGDHEALVLQSAEKQEVRIAFLGFNREDEFVATILKPLDESVQHIPERLGRFGVSQNTPAQPLVPKLEDCPEEPHDNKPYYVVKAILGKYFGQVVTVVKILLPKHSRDLDDIVFVAQRCTNGLRFSRDGEAGIFTGRNGQDQAIRFAYSLNPDVLIQGAAYMGQVHLMRIMDEAVAEIWKDEYTTDEVQRDQWVLLRKIPQSPAMPTRATAEKGKIDGDETEYYIIRTIAGKDAGPVYSEVDILIPVGSKGEGAKFRVQRILNPPERRECDGDRLIHADAESAIRHIYRVPEGEALSTGHRKSKTHLEKQVNAAAKALGLIAQRRSVIKAAAAQDGDALRDLMGDGQTEA